MANVLDLFSDDPEEDPPPRPRGGVDDTALDQVEAWFEGQQDFEQRFGEVFRQSIDEVLDGQRTGRYDIKQLAKTEKTYLGTKVEIVCQAAFEFERGRHMDYLIAGHEVDSKFSIDAPHRQSIPGEAVDQICLLLHADDYKGIFTVGLLRTTAQVLNSGGANRDGKRGISKSGRSSIRWLVPKGSLPENLLLSLPDQTRNAIFDGTPAGRRGGQKRTNRLFSLVPGRLIRREVVLAVARQDDGPKRVRDARIHLRINGILVLGHQGEHPRICRDLGMPIPEKGQWISLRVVPNSGNDGRRVSFIGGVGYSLARPGEAEHVGPGAY